MIDKISYSIDFKTCFLGILSNHDGKVFPMQISAEKQKFFNKNEKLTGAANES